MKIKYEFANETVEIEVSEEWGAILVDLDRQEYNNDHAQSRRHCSLDALNVDGNLIPADENMEQTLIDAEEKERLTEAITRLEPRQQRLIQQVFFEGRKYTDIAREEGIDRSAASHAMQRAINKLKNFL